MPDCRRADARTAATDGAAPNGGRDIGRRWAASRTSKREFSALGTVAGGGKSGRAERVALPPSTLYPVTALRSLSSGALSSAQVAASVPDGARFCQFTASAMGPNVVIMTTNSTDLYPMPSHSRKEDWTLFFTRSVS